MVNARFKAFFDRPGIKRAVDRSTLRVLSRFGAFVRRTAKSSIRRRKRVSDPGKPPSSHTGKLKRFIWFSYDPKAKSVVVGPTSFGSGESKPELLEHGGTGIVVAQKRGKRTKKNATYKARPFMGPAFEKEQPKLPGMWADALGG